MPLVMIVDDDRITTGLLKTILELDGFEVILTPDEVSALKLTHEKKPDAFVVDYHLHDSEGIDFVKKVRTQEAFKKAPIIMASGVDYEEEALKNGANHFLIKPFDPGDLSEILEDLLEDD